MRANYPAPNPISTPVRWFACLIVTALAATGLLTGLTPFAGKPTETWLPQGTEPQIHAVADLPQVEANPAVLVKNLDTVAVPQDYAAEGTVDTEVYGPLTQPASADDSFQTVSEVSSEPVPAEAAQPGDILKSGDSQTTVAEENLPSDLKAVHGATTPVETSVAVAGISWENPNLTQLNITYRVKQNGVWGLWTETTVEPVFETSKTTRIGTEALILIDVQAVEVAVESVEGTAVENLQLSVVEPFQTEGEAKPVYFTTAVPAAQEKPYVPGEKPTIVTREQWKANPKYLDWDPKYAPLKAVVLHHTASTNDYTAAQAPGIVAGIYYYHAVTLGWGDIGYHFLVDRYGVIYQGRDGDINRVNEGGHAYGFNTGTVGISMIGNFMKEQPTDATLDSVAKLAAWKLKAAKLNPMEQLTEKKSHLKPGNSQVTGYVFDGHRAWNYTSCPGDAFWPRMGEMRSQVQDLMNGKLNLRVKPKDNTTGSTPAQPNKPTEPVKPPTPVKPPVPAKPTVQYRAETKPPALGDLFAIADNGDLVNYGGVSVPRGTPIKKGQGWLGAQWFDTVDWDGDGFLDVIAIFKTGELKVYFTNAKGTFNRVAKIGHGFGNYKGYLKRDAKRKPLLMTISPTGEFTRWENNGANYVSKPKKIGHGWGIIRFPMVVDYDANGTTDILALDYQAKLWNYPMTETGFTGRKMQVGHGWNIFNRLTTLPGKGEEQFILGVTPDGKLSPYRVTKQRIDRLPIWMESFNVYRMSGEN